MKRQSTRWIYDIIETNMSKYIDVEKHAFTSNETVSKVRNAVEMVLSRRILNLQWSQYLHKH